MKKITSTKYSIDEETQMKVFFTKEIKIENHFGLVNKLKWFNSEDEVKMVYEKFYDENNNLKKQTLFYPKIDYIKVWTFERDNNAKVSKINFKTTDNPSDSNFSETEYIYSIDGKSVEIIEREIGEVPIRSIRHFDEFGNREREIEFDDEMQIVSKTIYKYYSNNKIKRSDTYGIGGEDLISHSLFNLKGEIIERVHYGHENMIEKYFYKYNSEGFWVERKTMVNNELRFIEIREINQKEHSS